jgi:hypothetical protein
MSMYSRFASTSGQGVIWGFSGVTPAGVSTVKGQSWDMGWLGVDTGPLSVLWPLPLPGKQLMNLVALFYVRIQSFQQPAHTVSAE